MNKFEQQPSKSDRALPDALTGWEVGGPGRHALEQPDPSSDPTWRGVDYPAQHRAEGTSEAAARAAFASLQASYEENQDPADLDELFGEYYAGSYRSLFDAAHGLTEVDELEGAVKQLWADSPIGRAVQIDYNTVYALMRERWDIVEDGNGWVHVFER